jgi:hypothetical protein
MFFIEIMILVKKENFPVDDFKLIHGAIEVFFIYSKKLFLLPNFNIYLLYGL